MKTMIYVYGIVPNASGYREVTAVNGQGVIVIPYNNLAMVAEKVSYQNFRMLDKETIIKRLLEHQCAIERLASEGFKTIIPVKFGTTLARIEDAYQLLRNSRGLLEEILLKIRNVTEVDVACTWANFDQAVMELSVNCRKDLHVHSDQHHGVHENNPYRIAAFIQGIVESEKQRLKRNIVPKLMALCDRHQQHDVMNEQMIFNTAFLMPMNYVALFGKELEKLNSEFQYKLNFRMVGPLPCYSFYTLDVRRLPYADIKHAKNILGIGKTTSIKKTKLAYLDKVKIFHPDRQGRGCNEETFDRINKAYRTIADYSCALRPATPDVEFSLARNTVEQNCFFLKLRE